MSTRRHDGSVRGRGVDEVAVADVMRRDVLSVRPEMPIASLAERMLAEDVSSAPVVDVMGWLARDAGYAVPGVPEPEPAAAPPRETPSLVMVVDDDHHAREELAELLREEGYAVMTAANGRDALHALRAGSRPALILLDLAMPVMDGGSFAAELRKDPSLGALPVVLMSAQASVRAVAARVEARACLVKPVTYPALLDTVEKFGAA